MFTEAAAAQATFNSDYPRFETVMTKMGYDWEPMTVTTSDDYILTTFHILGKTGGSRDTSQGAVLIQHGDQEDGTSWLTNYTDTD